MRFLVDMNLSPRWVEFIRTAGFEAVHWSDIGSGSATDAELMLWAATNGCIVLTNDLDFGAVLAATRLERPSVVQIRGDALAPNTIGAAVMAAVRQTSEELQAGAIVSVDIVRARVRILPLRD